MMRFWVKNEMLSLQFQLGFTEDSIVSQQSGYAPLGEVLACLSRALDLVEGQPQGHSVRTAMIAVEICKALQLSEIEQRNAFYASILKDAGCSTNAARIYQFFGGDEREFKKNAKFVDWPDTFASFKHALKHIEPKGTTGAKLKKLAGLARKGPRLTDEITQARCQRGAMIARSLGFGETVAMGIHSLDEHWDGKGSPQHLSGDAIPTLALIIGLAQTMEVFVAAFGVQTCMDMVNRRSGRWFSPEISSAGLSLANHSELWQLHTLQLAGEEVPLPVSAQVLEDVHTSIDAICIAFAQIIDAKSAFTGEHSTRVARYSLDLGRYFGFEADRLAELNRAALLHDIGKLAVSNDILEKPGKLTEDEFAVIRSHPRYSHELLDRVKGFERITQLASAHHERLDGKGYWRGLGAEHLDLDMRILTTADVLDALTAKRPYRDAMPVSSALSIMERDRGTAFDPECLEAVFDIYSNVENLAA